jgi:hypothetical protein
MQLKLFTLSKWMYADSLILHHEDAYPLRSLRLLPYFYRFHSSPHSLGTLRMGLDPLVSLLPSLKALKIIYHRPHERNMHLPQHEAIVYELGQPLTSIYYTIRYERCTAL